MSFQSASASTIDSLSIGRNRPNHARNAPFVCRAVSVWIQQVLTTWNEVLWRHRCALRVARVSGVPWPPPHWWRRDRRPHSRKPQRRPVRLHRVCRRSTHRYEVAPSSLVTDGRPRVSALVDHVWRRCSSGQRNPPASATGSRAPSERMPGRLRVTRHLREAHARCGRADVRACRERRQSDRRFTTRTRVFAGACDSDTRCVMKLEETCLSNLI